MTESTAQTHAVRSEPAKAVRSEPATPGMRAKHVAAGDRQEASPGEDRVLGEPIQWAAFSHRQLYDAIHTDNEPGKAHERAREWDELAKEVESAADELAEVLRESEAGWRGDAADAGRAVMHDLSRRGEDASRTTQGVGRFLTEQADVMERAKAEMPEPPEVPAEEKHRRIISGGGPPEMMALVTVVAAAEKQRQDDKHQQAVDVMTAMETGSRRVDESTPGFKGAHEGTSKVRERLDAGQGSGARQAEPGPDAGGQKNGMNSQTAPVGPGGPTAPDGQGAPNSANQPGGGGAASGLAAGAGGGGPVAQDPGAGKSMPGSGDPNAQAKQFSALSGGTPPGPPDGGGPEAQPDAGGSPGPSTGSAPELSEFTSDPSQTTSSSTGPALNTGGSSGGSYSGGSPISTMQGGSGEQQHWNQFSGAHGPNARNQKWSGSLSDKNTPSKTTPEGLTGGMPETSMPPGGAGGGSVPPLSAGGGSGGSGVSLAPGGSAGVAPGAGGGGATPTGGGSSGGGSSSGGTSTGGMGGMPMGAGAGGARQGGDEDKEHRAPEFLKDQTLFEAEERPAPPVIGEKFKKKQGGE